MVAQQRRITYCRFRTWCVFVQCVRGDWWVFSKLWNASNCFMIYSRVLCLHQRLLGIIKIVILAEDRWVEERIQSRSFMLVSFLKCSMSKWSIQTLWVYQRGRDDDDYCATTSKMLCVSSKFCLSVIFFYSKTFLFGFAICIMHFVKSYTYCTINFLLFWNTEWGCWWERPERLDWKIVTVQFHWTVLIIASRALIWY